MRRGKRRWFNYACCDIGPGPPREGPGPMAGFVRRLALASRGIIGVELRKQVGEALDFLGVP